MAGNTILLGSDWGNDAHWGGETAVKPVDDDQAWISPTLNADVTGTLDQGGVDLDLLHIPPQYIHNLGASGTPLKISGQRFEHFGGGGLYLSADANAAAQDIIETRIQCTHSRVITELTSTADDKGDYHKVFLYRGTVRLLSDIAFDDAAMVEVGYVNSPAGDVTLTIASGAETLPTLYQYGGMVYSNRLITTANAMAGMLVQDVAAITNLHVFPGATVKYNTSATCTIAFVRPGGTLILNDTLAQKTFTDLWVAPGGRVVYPPEHLLTVTNGIHDWRHPQL